MTGLPPAGRHPVRAAARSARGRREPSHHDLIVVGGGAAGMSAARRARRRGSRVALVQTGPVGGDCTFHGCVPSKTMIEAAGQGADFAAAMTRVAATVARIAATETADVLRAEGIEVVEGRGRLLGADRVDVDGRVLTTRSLIIATGSGPLLPPVPGLDEVGPLTNESVFDLIEQPSSLLVLGGGPVGTELAQAFARLGTTVTLVERAERLLPGEEAEASAVVAASLSADGVDIRTGRSVTSVARVGSGVRAGLDDGGEVTAARILVAVGRRPLTDGLGLDAAGIATDGGGWIRTDDHLRTNVAGVWAAGDITGRSQHTHSADTMGRTAAGNALSRIGFRRFRDAWMPAVTFTSPEVARVGLTEDDAAGPGVRVAYLPMTEVDRAVTAGRTAGYIKLVVGPRRGTGDLAGGRLLGATIVAERAGEMIALPTLAIRSHMLPARLAMATQAYPTWSIGVQQAAAQLFAETGGRRARPSVNAAGVGRRRRGAKGAQRGG